MYTVVDYARAVRHLVTGGERAPSTEGWRYVFRRRFAYGDDASYRKAIAFLDGHGLIEDWGCGTAYASRFVRRSPYWGIDGAEGYADEVADLVQRRSSTPCLLLRHVLEHNPEWATVLDNAIASFTRRMVLVTYTPFGDRTRVIHQLENGVPEIGFRKEELLRHFAGIPLEEEELTSRTKFGREHLFYLRRA
jgi:hypothetical protein